MKGGIKHIVRRIHHSIPPEIRKSYRFLIVLVNALRKYLLPVYQCTFMERESGEAMRLVYMGWDHKMLHYMVARFTDDAPEIKRLARRTPGSICRHLRGSTSNADITLVESYGLPGRCGWNKGFLMPHWMEMEVGMETFEGKSRTKNILRNIRKYHLGYEVRTRMEDFDLFYHRMYVPFVRARHGLSSDVADYKHFAGKFRKQESMLFFIVVDNEPLAAAYIEDKGEVHRLSAFGVLDGSEEVFRMGVVGALYYFVIRYFGERGETTLMVGNSKPFVLDGVTEFKRQIGGSPHLKDLPGQEKLWLIPSAASAVSRQALKANPVYHLLDGTLGMAVFIDEKDFADQDQFRKYFKRLNCEQVTFATVYCLEPPDRIRTWLEEEQAVRIVDISHGKSGLFDLPD